MSEGLTPAQAYRKGRAAQRRPGDWDEALARFSRRWSPSSGYGALTTLETAWCDGWDDAQEDNWDRDPKRL